MNFKNENDYIELKIEATKNRQSIGDFVIFLLKFWKENKENKKNQR